MNQHKVYYLGTSQLVYNNVCIKPHATFKKNGGCYKP